MTASNDSPTADEPARFGATPGAAFVSQLLRVQASTPPRRAVARVLGLSPLSDDAQSWYLGAVGEQEVARVLARLGDGWTVVHSVPVGDRGSDIDHLIVGPSGVFTLNAKLHEDATVWVGARRILVNGHKTDYLRNARFEAARAARTLMSVAGRSLDVTPLIVLVRVRRLTVRERPQGVFVLELSGLARWLRRRPQALSSTEVAFIGAKAASRETWKGEEPDSADGSAFAALQRQVRRAKYIRATWAAAALAATISIGLATLTRWFPALDG